MLKAKLKSKSDISSMLQTAFETFSLDNFEGPLDFLLHLIQKDEIHIHDISIQSLTDQFLQKWSKRSIEKGAEFIGTASYLIFLKSRALLPQEEQEEVLEEIEEDPHFEVIHHLVDYCRFKHAAKMLAERHEQQSTQFVRGMLPYEWKKPLGIEHISLEDLASLVQTLMKKVSSKSTIQEENFRVSDKISLIRSWIKKEERLPFSPLFDPNKPRLELIVTFLAILELMKLGEIIVGKETATQTIFLFARTP